MRCRICKRVITDPASLSRGIGATCWARLHPAKVGKGKRAKVRKGRAGEDEEQVEFVFEVPTSDF